MPESSRYPLLSKINSPLDLKKLSIIDLELLSTEIRHFLIETVAQTGGHLGSNLGAVELTLAIHYTYNTPKDQIVWDVGAQAYVHKILTGRFSRFHTNRKYGGIAGFPRRDESPYDAFGAGHSSTSISAALGMAVARDLARLNHKVVAVIGDGGMTGGLAFEGLNNAGSEGRDITVVLNDNRMAISPNVGALSLHLASIRSDPRFEKLKDTMWQLTGKLPQGSQLRKALHGVDAGIRAMLIPGIWFERLGFRYVGPIDGHNLPDMVKMFAWLRDLPGPVVIHLLTEKGKGYEYAENDSLNLHGVSEFNPKTGPIKGSKGDLTYSAHFSDELLKLAIEDDKIVAITPAMIEGSALADFQKTLPCRCFDVGIAEQHALTFAAGLATQGFKPVVAIYSTFFQRAYDQLIHDIALQELSVVFGVDRVGLVGEDGPTHHGTFDISFMRAIPGLRILIPRNSSQLRTMLRASLSKLTGSTAIRFPRGKSAKFIDSIDPSSDVTCPEMLLSGDDGVVISSGPLLEDLYNVLSELNHAGLLNLSLVDLRCVKPLHSDYLLNLSAMHDKWLSIEENQLMGGIGSALLEFISDNELPVQMKRLGLPDRFITHGDRKNLLEDARLDAIELKSECLEFFRPKHTVIKRLLQQVGIED